MKRYVRDEETGVMSEDEFGLWVNWQDVYELQKELEKAQVIIDSITPYKDAALKLLKNSYPYTETDTVTTTECVNKIRALTASHGAEG